MQVAGLQMDQLEKLDVAEKPGRDHAAHRDRSDNGAPLPLPRGRFSRQHVLYTRLTSAECGRYNSVRCHSRALRSFPRKPPSEGNRTTDSESTGRSLRRAVDARSSARPQRGSVLLRREAVRGRFRYGRVTHRSRNAAARPGSGDALSGRPLRRSAARRDRGRARAEADGGAARVERAGDPGPRAEHVAGSAGRDRRPARAPDRRAGIWQVESGAAGGLSRARRGGDGGAGLSMGSARRYGPSARSRPARRGRRFRRGDVYDFDSGRAPVSASPPKKASRPKCATGLRK